MNKCIKVSKHSRALRSIAVCLLLFQYFSKLQCLAVNAILDIFFFLFDRNVLQKVGYCFIYHKFSVLSNNVGNL